MYVCCYHRIWSLSALPCMHKPSCTPSTPFTIQTRSRYCVVLIEESRSLIPVPATPHATRLLKQPLMKGGISFFDPAPCIRCTRCGPCSAYVSRATRNGKAPAMLHPQCVRHSYPSRHGNGARTYLGRKATLVGEQS